MPINRARLGNFCSVQCVSTSNSRRTLRSEIGLRHFSTTIDDDEEEDDNESSLSFCSF